MCEASGNNAAANQHLPLHHRPKLNLEESRLTLVLSLFLRRINRFMRRLLSLLLLALPLAGCSQIDLKKLEKSVNETVQGSKPLSESEVVAGLKEALQVGSRNAAGSAAKTDGYFGNNLIKIPFPPEAKSMETKLRSLGMNKQVDDFILTVNRAAEEAAKEAAPVFLDAITGMTVTDGFNILRGADTAATGYLRQKTSGALHTKFKPIIQRAIEKVSVTRYWNPLATTYNKIPFVDPVNPNLEEYITQRALNGLFTLVAQEETKIRRDPAARVTALLKRVFGN